MASPQRPEDVEVDETVRFVAPLLAGRRRVLDVGCGNGLLARRLAADGFQVTALDRSLDRTERAPGIRYLEADFLSFEDAPHDALVFSASLHHLSPLDRALENAERLLVPGGQLVVADFDLDAPDRDTARWYYDLEGLLVAAGCFRPDRVGGTDIDDPLERWHAEHRPEAHRPGTHRHHGHRGQGHGPPEEAEPPLHTGAAMREGLARRFSNPGASTGPYLYRYLVGGLEPSPHALRLALWVHDAEVRRIAAGALKPVGLRLWARRHGVR